MSLDAAFTEVQRVAPVSPPGGITLRPLFNPRLPAFQAGWLDKSDVEVIAMGNTEEEALNNLVLVLTGKGAEVDRQLRLREAIAAESLKQAEYDQAKAAREAIEQESIAIEVTR